MQFRLGFLVLFMVGYSGPHLESRVSKLVLLIRYIRNLQCHLHITPVHVKTNGAALACLPSLVIISI